MKAKANPGARPVSPGDVVARARRSARWWLTWGALVGPAGFTLTWLGLGLSAPLAVSLSQPVSGFGIGPFALLMNSAFVVGGLCLLFGLVGIFGLAGGTAPGRLGWSSAALLLLSPVGMMLCGVFTLRAFVPHFVGFIMACVCPAVSFAVAGLYLRKRPGWRRAGGVLLAAAPLALLLSGAFLMSFEPQAAGRGEGFAGLIQRALITLVTGAFAFLAWEALNASASAAEAPAREGMVDAAGIEPATPTMST